MIVEQHERNTSPTLHVAEILGLRGKKRLHFGLVSNPIDLEATVFAAADEFRIAFTILCLQDGVPLPQAASFHADHGLRL